MSEPNVGGFTGKDADAIFVPMGSFPLACQFSSVIVDTFLAGVLAMQMFWYFKFHRGDKTWLKGLVGYLGVMNVFVTIYYWVYMSYLFVNNFGNFLPWLEVRWLAQMPWIDGITVSAIQLFFAYRAFLLLNRNWFVLYLIGGMVLGALGGAIGLTIVFGSQSSLLGATNSGPTLITWLALTTAADLTIATCIITGLLRSKSGWKHTDKLVTKLVRLTFEAQLLPTCLAMAYLIEWIITPASLLGATFQALQCKTYTFGLIVTLLSRDSLREEAACKGGTAAKGAQIYGMTSRGPVEVNIAVQTDTSVNLSEAKFGEVPTTGSTYKMPSDNDSDLELARPSSAELTGSLPTSRPESVNYGHAQ